MTPLQSRRAARAGTTRLAAAAAITALFLVVELVGGILTNSLALIADAGHMLSDVAALSLALFAAWIAGRPAGGGRTYGYFRAEILAALVNGLLLAVVAALVAWQSIGRLGDPPGVDGVPLLGVASAGLAANGVAAWLLARGAAHDLNRRAALLHILGDLLGSAAAIIAGLIIIATGWLRADPIAGLAIVLLVAWSAWRLLRQTVEILLEAAPRGVDIEEVRRHILDADGVGDVHDLHAWTITSGMNVVSAHVVLDRGADPSHVLDALCGCLAADFDIEHSTFQFETTDRRRLEEAGHR